mmetsp:Transcript_3805/g.5699  ORF Transcript_3805/g.5699 Transcript_3805/m.5699 type:complete len:200 (+) Transcript_3805:832-1431(+)
MGAMGGSEGIIDEKVEWGSKLLNESSLVLGLLLVETSILKHDNISFLGSIYNLGNLLSDTVGGKGNSLVKKLRHALGTRSKRELVLWAVLGASQMGADSYDGTLSFEVLNGRDGRTDTGIVSDGLSVEGNVDITTYKNLLSLELVIGKVLNGLLGLKLGSRSGAYTECTGWGKGAYVGSSEGKKGSRENFHCGLDLIIQ